MTDFNYAATQLQPESYQFDAKVLLKPLLEVTIADRLSPGKTLGGIEQLQAFYYELTAQDLPEYKIDLDEPKTTDITSQQKVVDTPILQEAIRWSKMEWRRIVKDIADVNARVELLGPKFAEKRDIVQIAGHSDPAISGLLTAARGTDSALTNKDSTTFVGWTKMIAELRSDLRGGLKQLYNTLPQWLLMTEDVYNNAEQVYNLLQPTQNVLSWLRTPIDRGGAGFGGAVYFSDHLGATVTDNVSAEDGTLNIMLGTFSEQTSMTLQTGFQREEAKRHEQEVRWFFMQRYRPVTLRTTGFYWENAVTV